jgi:hypothetical protein
VLVSSHSPRVAKSREHARAGEAKLSQWRLELLSPPGISIPLQGRITHHSSRDSSSGLQPIKVRRAVQNSLEENFNNIWSGIVPPGREIPIPGGHSMILRMRVLLAHTER